MLHPNRRPSRIPAVLAVLAVAALPVMITGCDIGGGVAAAVTVTLKPSETSGDSVVASDTPGAQPGTSPAAGGGTPGTFKGRVVLEGAVPAFATKPIYPKGANIKDKVACAADADIPNQRLIVGDSGGVKNVYVYLSKAPKGAPKTPVPDEVVVFDQKGCVFLPHCLLIRTDQLMKVKSGDPVAHNTHTYPIRQDGINTLISPNDRVGLDLVYGKAESVPVEAKCDFHTWMKAYHLPLDHPFAALTDENGEFEITGLPPGDYRFQIWHEAVGYVQRNFKVNIKPGAPTEVTIPYDAGKVTP